MMGFGMLGLWVAQTFMSEISRTDCNTLHKEPKSV